MPVWRRQGLQFFVADALGAYIKVLPIVADPTVPGAFMGVLAIVPADCACISPLGVCQHEIWLTGVGNEPYSAAIGPYVIHDPVTGAAT